MNNFNFNRFARTFKWCFYEQRGKLFKWSVVTLMVTLAVELFFVFLMRKANNGAEPPYEMAVQISCGMNTIYVLIAFMVAFCNVFAWLKNKQKRAAFLTLPASNLERWLSAIIFALILFPLGISLGYFLGDLARSGLYCALGEEWLPGYKYFFELFNGNSPKIHVLPFSIQLWGASCFILAGTWLRKGQFVITVIFQILLSFLLKYIADTFHNEIAEMLVKNSSEGFSAALEYGVSIVLILVSIFHFWLSYRLFTRFQIITSKWTNL